MITLTFRRDQQEVQRTFLCKEVVLGPNVPEQSQDAIGCNLSFFPNFRWKRTSKVRFVEEKRGFAVINARRDPTVRIKGKRFHKARLSSGDELQIGDIKVQFDGKAASSSVLGFEWDDRSVRELVEDAPHKYRYRHIPWHKVPFNPYMTVKKRLFNRRFAVALVVVLSMGAILMVELSQSRLNHGPVWQAISQVRHQAIDSDSETWEFSRPEEVEATPMHRPDWEYAAEDFSQSEE